MTRLAPIDLAVLGVYGVGIFSLAQYVSRRKTGEVQGSAEYFLASRSLPWWAIGASLIAANISAEQIVGMSGSGFAIGLAISSYEWMAALTLLIVGKYFLPIFLDNRIYTMPQFLEYRYGTRIRTLMAVFWLGLYVFVNLTSIIWLGSIAVNQVSGLNQELALALLGGFALLYQFWGGLKAVALTDIVQVTLLFAGGVVISALTLGKIGDGRGIVAGFQTARPLLGSFDQAFQYIQEYTGFFTPGIVVIFLLGLFWKRATETAALSAAVGSFVLSLALKLEVPALPFMDRVGVVFVAALLVACAVSLARPAGEAGNRIDTASVDYSTSRGFAAGSAGVVMILAALYATWW